VRASTATATDPAGLAARVAPLVRGRVGIDGPDAAGKTTLADAVAALTGLPRVRADDFLARDEVRHRRGRLSPEGYYADAFDLPALRAAVRGYDTVLVDGVFLFRPELDDLWDVRVFVDVDPATQKERVLARDVGDPAEIRARYAARYRPAYETYRNAIDPESRADLVLP
jgi:uridine kinase